MDTNRSIINAFKLCWNAIFKESEQFNNAFFNKEYCAILDSRDNNFGVVENRLAYIYKYGCYNITFVETCLTKFLSEYSESESVFPLENLKVCSLSNGPGLDIVGLLCALCKSKNPLKKIPQLKAINLYASWSTLFEIIVKTAYETSSLKSCIQHFFIPSDNIHLIQCDIYSTLSTDARNCISDSNVILMFKTFVSTKATPDTFGNAIKEVFSLLQPGSLIFFIGSKNNTRQISKKSHCSQYVKCIFGPQKVTLKNIPIDETVVSSIGIKPDDSGSAYFIVWQKRDISEVHESTKKKRKRNRKNKTSKSMEDAKELLDDDPVISKFKDNSDSVSELSFTSGSRQTDSLSDELKSDSNSSLFNLVDHSEIKGENTGKEQNLLQTANSVENITSTLDKISIKDFGYEDQKLSVLQANTIQSKNNCVSTLASNTEEIKFETSYLEKKFESEAPGKVGNSFETTGTENPEKVKSQIITENAQEKKVNLNFMKTKMNSVDKIFQTNSLSPVSQKMNDKEMSESACSKKAKKNKKQSKNKTEDCPELSTKSENGVKQPKKLLQQNLSSVNKSFDDLLSKFERNVSLEEADNHKSNDRNRQDFHSLFQRCDNLITALEKLTADIKLDVSSSSNVQTSVREYCCTRQACRNFTCVPSCCCSVNVMHCCCKKVCDCRMVQYNCQFCSNSCTSKNTQEYIFHPERTENLSRPYITIPLENKDIVQILTSKKS